MNPQRTAHLGQQLQQIQTPQTNAPDSTGDSSRGIGSAQSGYAGPENGPFECGNCIHFDGAGKCDNPQVQSDPEVNGQVEAEGCCNLFSPAGNQGGEEESEEGSEEAALPGAGEGGQ